MKSRTKALLSPKPPETSQDRGRVISIVAAASALSSAVAAVAVAFDVANLVAVAVAIADDTDTNLCEILQRALWRAAV